MMSLQLQLSVPLLRMPLLLSSLLLRSLYLYLLLTALSSLHPFHMRRSQLPMSMQLQLSWPLLSLLQLLSLLSTGQQAPFRLSLMLLSSLQLILFLRQLGCHSWQTQPSRQLCQLWCPTLRQAMQLWQTSTAPTPWRQATAWAQCARTRWYRIAAWECLAASRLAAEESQASLAAESSANMSKVMITIRGRRLQQYLIFLFCLVSLVEF